MLRFHLGLLLLLTAALAAATTVAVPVVPQRNVLILHSWDDNMPWQKQVRDGFHARLREQTGNPAPAIFEERLDAARLGWIGKEKLWIDYLKQKYTTVKFDLVITESNPAARFLIMLSGMWLDTPRVFVNPGSVEIDSARESLLPVDEDIARNMRVALDLTPAARRLVVVGNLTPSRITNARAAWEKHFRGRVSFEAWSDDFSFAELYARAAQLPSDAVILYSLVGQDRTGARAVPYDVLKQLSAAASVPVFTTHDSLLGSGAVGGYLLSGKRVGRMIADLAAGAPHADFARQSTSANEFDSRALARWQTPDSRLPPDSSIHFREPSFWQENRRAILAVLLFVTLETLILIALAQALRSRRIANAALTAARDTAEAANRAKSTFLANMSHELRTPMNAIMGMTDLALRRATDPKQRDQLGKVTQASRHLLHVINDILDISKIEAERLTLEKVTFKLGEVLENFVSLIGHKVLEKHLKLLIDLTPEAARLTLIGDPLRLGQILLNLAANALKFTEQGSIVVRMRIAEESPTDVLLRIEVQDTGIGIAATDQQRLFTAFEQADGSMTRKYGGTGLGLAISKRLAQLMGGEIGVDSRPGEGSTFWVTVRLGKPAGNAVPPAPTFVSDTAAARLKANHSGKRILLAEDEPINQEVSRGLLEDAGLVVDLAEDGAMAVMLAKQNRYDLILMDIQMPHLNGVDATKAIRALLSYAVTPILAMTANAFDEDRQVCLDAGMNDHIAKPVDPEVLFNTLLKWLEQSRLQASPPGGNAAGE